MQLRPSAAHIWTKCPANPLMASKMPPEVPGDAAREGTCAAWVAEMVLTGVVACAAELIGTNHENGWLVEPDMAQKIQKYIDHLHKRGGKIFVERKVRLNPLIEGTPDAWALLDDDGVLHGDDLKYGFSIVEPYKNPQVSIYLGAIIRFLTARGVTIKRVVVGIYQPRSWHPAGIYRTWSCFPEELMAFVHEIEAAGEKTQVADPRATPGDHCGYCPAASTCAALAAANYRIFDMLCTATQRHMTAVEMAEELTFLEKANDMLQGRMNAVTTEAEARVKRGETIPGWHMEQRAGQRRFTAPASVIRALTGKNPEVPKMVTPAELERMGASEAVVAKLSETPRTTPRLKRIAPGYFTNMFSKKG